MIQVEDNKEILDEVINQSTGLTVRNFPTYNRAWLEDSNTITYGELLKNCCELLGVFGTIIPNASYGVFRYIELGKSTETYDFYENLYAEEYDCSGYNDFVFINGYSSREKKTIEFETLWGDESNSYDLTKIQSADRRMTAQAVRQYTMYKIFLTAKQANDFIIAPIHRLQLLSTADLGCRLVTE